MGSCRMLSISSSYILWATKRVVFVHFRPR